MTFNPLAALVDALKVHPEQHSLPEGLEGAELDQLAAARNRFAEIAQVATELRKLVDAAMAGQLENAAYRYGETIYRPSTRGRPKIVDEEQWWAAIEKALKRTEDPAGLVSKLYPANSFRFGGLPLLASLLEVDEQSLRQTFIDYEPPTTVLDAVPLAKAPKWAQRLAEGQASNRKMEQPDAATDL